MDIARAEADGLGRVRVQTIEWLWAPLIRILGERFDVMSSTVGIVHQYIGKRRGEGVKGQTIRREVQAFVRGLRIAKRDRAIFALPFDPDDIPKIRSDAPNRSQQGKLWDLAQIDLVLSRMHPKAVSAGHRDRCRLIMLTGLRIEELHRLQPSWVVKSIGGQAILQVPAEGAKWGHPREIPLCAEADGIIARRAPFRRLKPNKSLAWASSKAKILGVVTPRDLRHFYLTHAARLSGDPIAAQRLGGHANVATTGLYLHADAQRTIAAGTAVSDWIAMQKTGSKPVQ